MSQVIKQLLTFTLLLWVGLAMTSGRSKTNGAYFQIPAHIQTHLQIKS